MEEIVLFTMHLKLGFIFCAFSEQIETYKKAIFINDFLMSVYTINFFIEQGLGMIKFIQNLK